MKYCSISDCDRPHRGHSYCDLHYQRFKKYGDPLKTYTLRGANHGRYNTPEYRSWAAMKRRCYNPKSVGFEHYGGRGIRVCDRWLLFENFYEDMGDKPNSKYTLDRVNVNGDYEPSNCRWATLSTQTRNRRLLPSNTSGHTGIDRTNNKVNKWRSTITINYKRVNLGVFKTKEEAAIAYTEAKKKLK